MFANHLRYVQTREDSCLSSATLGSSGNTEARISRNKQRSLAFLPSSIAQPPFAVGQADQGGHIGSRKWIDGRVIVTEADSIQKKHQNVHGYEFLFTANAMKMQLELGQPRGLIIT